MRFPLSRLQVGFFTLMVLSFSYNPIFAHDEEGHSISSSDLCYFSFGVSRLRLLPKPLTRILETKIQASNGQEKVKPVVNLDGGTRSYFVTQRPQTHRIVWLGAEDSFGVLPVSSFLGEQYDLVMPLQSTSQVGPDEKIDTRIDRTIVQQMGQTVEEITIGSLEKAVESNVEAANRNLQDEVLNQNPMVQPPHFEYTVMATNLRDNNSGFLESIDSFYFVTKPLEGNTQLVVVDNKGGYKKWGKKSSQLGDVKLAKQFQGLNSGVDVKQVQIKGQDILIVKAENKAIVDTATDLYGASEFDSEVSPLPPLYAYDFYFVLLDSAEQKVAGVSHFSTHLSTTIPQVVIEHLDEGDPRVVIKRDEKDTVLDFFEDGAFNVVHMRE